jgi:hypothetical protein
VTSERRCDWCNEPLPADARKSMVTCSKRCRQRRQRFRVDAAGATPRHGPMRFAYADPPYPGCARRYYGHREVDHGKLVLRLIREFPDGWALSTSEAALVDVLWLIPRALRPRVRIWYKGGSRRRGTTSHDADNAYEVLIIVGGRARRPGDPRLEDVLWWGGRQPTHPGALIGMKNAAFCEWMFRLLGATAEDALVDLFPGSGIVTRAWRDFVRGVKRQGAMSRLAGAGQETRRR